MSVLENLIRIHRWMLDDKRRQLTELERYAARIRSDLTALEESMEQEQRAANRSFEAGSGYASFLAASLERRRKLQQALANLDSAMQAARDELTEVYQEVKRFETARDHAAERSESERKRRDQLVLDEMGLQQHRRSLAAGRERDF